ncbi:MAG: VWA domain-containing protein [Pirellulaceae bacterium]|nr:VWA domain-containing protein [Pirellulaceae bacterium]
MIESTQITDIAIELARPWMLWCLLALIPIAWYFWKSLSDFPAWQRRVSFAARSLIVGCLVLALAGLTLLQPTKKMFVVLAVDRSQSVDSEATAKIDEFIKQTAEARGSNDLAVIDFAAEPAGLSAFDAERTPPPEDGKRATNIASAIETAIASVPPSHVPHVVVLSDGRQTLGDAVQAAAGAKVPISTVPLPSRDEPEVQVAEVTAPAQVRQGEPFYVEVTIASNHADQGFIDVYRGDVLAIEQKEPIKIEEGETKLRFRQTVDDEKQVDYAVRVRGFTDTLLDNNSASAVVFASGKPTVLLVDSQVDQTNELRWALEEQGLLVQVRPVEGVPRSLSELQRFDCLMLSNVPATAMTLQQMEIIRTYVQDLGGGLVMLGGDQSFGLGGYYKTTLEEILPVRSNFEKEKEKPSLAMVLVIDKSGSMGGQKIELAKDAAKGAVELLSPRDQIGIIAFDGASYWISEIHSAADKGYVMDRISTIEASGGTNIYPGLSDAYDALVATSAKLKHVILMTDGHSTPGDYDGIVRDMVAARITLSSVACGAEADQKLLEELAQTGGGRYYMCEDPQSVPQIFAKETVTASKSAINELPFLPQMVRPTQVLNGLELDTAPFLLGYVVTRPKPTSEFILASESGDPLLVWWRYGLGMTVAFTSDAKSQWAAEWQAWPQFGPFWAQVTRHAMRKSDAKGVFVEIERHDERARLIVDSVDESGKFINGAETKVTVIDPSLGNKPIVMQQTAPGRYEAEFDTNKTGSYNLELNQNQNGVTTFRQTRGLVVGYPDELRLGPTNDGLLKQISQVSGGRFDLPAKEVFEPGERTARLALPLWPYLLMAALSLLVADVALRRIDFSLWFPSR